MCRECAEPPASALAGKARSHANDYRLGIRGAIRGYWSGAIDREQFTVMMGNQIDRGLRFAFAEGAADCGIKPDDYTDAERDAVTDAIVRELDYIDGLADDVQANSKKRGGLLQPLFDRSELWINRYRDLVNRGRVMACSDRKYRWELGQTEHCSTCERLAGQVRRGSFWESHVMPQHPPNRRLECGGWRCSCILVPTDEPLTRGHLPAVP